MKYIAYTIAVSLISLLSMNALQILGNACSLLTASAVLVSALERAVFQVPNVSGDLAGYKEQESINSSTRKSFRLQPGCKFLV